MSKDSSTKTNETNRDNHTQSKNVLLVYSVSHALKMETLLTGRGVACKLVPVPRHLSSDCGVCVRFNALHRPDVEDAVAAAEIETAGIFSI